MKLRSYQQSRRVISSALTRTLIVNAALKLLADKQSSSFSMDAVGAQAGVARMTVFNCFPNKGKLLEAVCDAMAEQGGLANVTDTLNTDKIDKAIALYVASFGAFYTQHQHLLKGLAAHANDDAELAQLLARRSDVRRAGLQWLVQRWMGRDPNRAPNAEVEAKTEQLRAVLCLEVFELMAMPSLPLSTATAPVTQMVLAILRSKQQRPIRETS